MDDRRSWSVSTSTRPSRELARPRYRGCPAPVDRGVHVPGDARRHAGRPARCTLGDGHAPALADRGGGDHPRRTVELEQVRRRRGVRARRDVLAGAEFIDQVRERLALVTLTDDASMWRSGTCVAYCGHDPDEAGEILDGYESADCDHVTANVVYAGFPE